MELGERLLPAAPEARHQHLTVFGAMFPFGNSNPAVMASLQAALEHRTYESSRPLRQSITIPCEARIHGSTRQSDRSWNFPLEIHTTPSHCNRGMACG